MTDDVQAAYDRALAAGATPLLAPAQKPWGQTVGYVRDLNGVLVELCSPMGAAQAMVTPAETNCAVSLGPRASEAARS